MCGFIGRLKRQRMVDPEKRPFTGALEFLFRRGPDSSKVWKSKDEKIELLHARLAIVDTDSRSHQPFTDPETGVTLVFVGEIYNYPILRREMAGYAFRTESDTEVLLALYLVEGVQGWKRVRGMFALVLVDPRINRLYLARDPVGKKPLFVSRWDEDVFFGTSLFSFLAVSGTFPDIRPESVCHYGEHGFIDPCTSVFQGVEPVLPGQVLEWDWNGALIQKTDCLPTGGRIYENESVQEVEKHIRELLIQSVDRRLTNNSSPTVLLSGGVDSTVVACVARDICAMRHPKAGLQLLTLGALVPYMNDERYARMAAKKMNLSLQVVQLELNRLGERVLASLDLQDEPLGMPSYFLLERLVSASARYGRILLTGDGGDEAFLGYGNTKEWQKNENEEIYGHYTACGPPIPHWMSNWGKRTITDVLVGHMFAKVDRASAEQGVEIRCPLVDWDLLVYLRSLPFNLLLKEGIDKSLLKDQLVGWPRSFVHRKKMGFTYNLRWLWLFSGYDGIRESIEEEALETFRERIPIALKKKPFMWGNLDIFKNFNEVWKLLAWSRFLSKYRKRSWR